MLKESLGSSRLGKKVDDMINKIEERLKLIDSEINDESPQNMIDADGYVIFFLSHLLFI